MKKKKILSILGSTGSIGVNTLELVRRNPDKFRVKALCAGSNVRKLATQIKEFSPALVSVKDEASLKALKKILGRGAGQRAYKITLLCGEEGAKKAATMAGVDTVVSAIVGAAGLVPTLAAIKKGRVVALANKETLVIAGEMVMKAVRKYGAKLIPVDSEHSAVYQAMKGHKKKDVKRIILTASGGALRSLPLSKLKNVTPAQALKHPNWDMGERITIDSATLMNKGLEVIEARWLFGLNLDKIDVVVHPESTIHSMVEFCDGSIMAQMGSSDMKGPISYAIGFPERVQGAKDPLTLSGKLLSFKDVDEKRYPALNLACHALTLGGSAPAVLNAADEVAVSAFLKGRIAFTSIVKVVEDVLKEHKVVKVKTIKDVISADGWARVEATRLIKTESKRYK
ncbi:MAG: 1-deoxy-D-xylulose-5-phosphate reductoisomerase [Deltaproteobacteria bacterium]|nr:1-deoxy-D-xylulose-5-phosphate reductoisomerase [Deltaproteobacteria bacterium]